MRAHFGRIFCLLTLLLTFALPLRSAIRPTTKGRIQSDGCQLSPGCIMEAETVYWRPSRAGLGFAMGQDLSALNASVLDIEPDFHFGFESAAGYRNAGGLEFLSRYIHFDTKASRAFTNADQTLWNLRIAANNLIGNPIVLAKGTYSLRYDVADVDLAAHMDFHNVILFRPFVGFRYLDLEQTLHTHYTTIGTAEVEETQKVDGYGTHCGADVLVHCGKGTSFVAGTGFSLLFSTSSIHYVNSGNVVNSLCVNHRLNHPIFEWETYVGLGLNWKCLDLEFGYQLNHLVNACANLQQVGFDFTQARETSLQMADLGLDGAYFKASYVF